MKSKRVEKRPKNSYGKKKAKQPEFTSSGPAIKIPKVYEEKLWIYTDGATPDNGSEDAEGSYAFLIIEDDRVLHEYSQHIESTTNNRCELMGVLTALQYIVQEGITDPVRLFSDSQYAVNGMTKWKVGWQNSNYAGKKNADLWKTLHKLADENPYIKYSWVKGHQEGDSIHARYNRRADELCNIALGIIEQSPVKKSIGGDIYPGDTTDAKQFLLDKYLCNTPADERELWFRCSDWARTVVQIMEEYKQSK